MSPGRGGFDAAGVWSVLDGDRGVLDTAVEELLVALGASNTAQWDAEDRARVATTPAEVATQKSVIDRLNTQRVRLIFELDRTLRVLLAPPTSAPPTTDTPGSLCDRLSVLHLRIARMTEAGAPVPRVAEVRAQAVELRWAFDVMLADVREGRRSFSVHEPNKLYGITGTKGGPGPGRATDDALRVAHVR